MITWGLTAVETGVFVALALVVVVALALFVVARSRENARAEALHERLLRSARSSPGRRVSFSAFEALPAPVVRYFRYVLDDGQPLIRAVRLQQFGTLRTGIDSGRWMPFTADHLIVPPAVSFVWNARVRLPVGAHLRVLDSYIAGVGSGRVSMLSAFPLASASAAPELDSGALHRYLAEAVWCPTALLPQAGVEWSAIDDRSALATLRDHHHTVSLEFRFAASGEVSGVYTPKRYRRLLGQYRECPWEGHFSRYEERGGMQVPAYGEVGWYDGGGRLHIVWKGRLLDAYYEAA